MDMNVVVYAYTHDVCIYVYIEKRCVFIENLKKHTHSHIRVFSVLSLSFWCIYLYT